MRCPFLLFTLLYHEGVCYKVFNFISTMKATLIDFNILHIALLYDIL